MLWLPVKLVFVSLLVRWFFWRGWLVGFFCEVRQTWYFIGAWLFVVCCLLFVVCCLLVSGRDEFGAVFGDALVLCLLAHHEASDVLQEQEEIGRAHSYRG